MPGRILFLVPYPIGEIPSQRFRFEQYLLMLTDKGFTYKFNSYYDLRTLLAIRRGSIFSIPALIYLYMKRIWVITQVSKFDYVFIHREATPVGPPILEWILVHILKCKIIYDFDDAIWLTDNTSERRIIAFLRNRSKVASICKWSYKISAGNLYLANYARQYNKSVVIMPTTIDTTKLHVVGDSPPQKESQRLTIGWTGSFSTLKYLSGLEPALTEIENLFPHVDFVAIADRPPDLKMPRLRFVKWSKETEVQDLVKFDIGIMPLPDDPWTNGKCGFKALQYMALGIPCIASAVGVNKEIIDHENNGILCVTKKDWIDGLSRLILNQDIRVRLGHRGRATVLQRYSVASNSDLFLSLFE